MSEQETQAIPDQPDNSAAETNDSFKTHPAWDNLLGELPEAWHSKVAPYLQEADRNFQNQLEKFTPFKQYVDEGVSADLISGGLNIARAIESNPQEVYASLREYLEQNGMLAEEAAAVASDMMDEADDSGVFGDIPDAYKQEIEELKQFRSEQEQRIYDQELAKATEEASADLDREMADLKSAYNITEAHEVAIYNLMNAAMGAGQDITLADAAKQLQQMVGDFAPIGGSQSSSAPMVIGNAGGAGIVSPDLSVPRDDKGKKAMLAQMFEQYQKSGQ
jgi:hypothetical protein